VDADGHIFIADTGNARVRRVDAATGVIATVAGTGVVGYNGDGIPAETAQLKSPAGLALDTGGHLFISDMGGHRVRRVDAVTGLITTVAGTGTPGYNGDDQPATSAEIRVPGPLSLDAAGNLLIGEVGGARIRRVDGTAVVPNRAPAADAVVTFAGPVCGASGGTLVQLNGSGSSDPDLDVIAYRWTGPFPEGGGTVTGISPVVTLPLGGPHAITLVVTDAAGAEATATAQITIADTSSPLLTVAHPAVSVAPATGTMTPVDVLAVTGATASDACDPNPSLTVHGPALFRRGSTTIVTIEAGDASGNTVSTEVEITVEQGGRPENPGPPVGRGPKT
jgi:hypothetical protein